MDRIFIDATATANTLHHTGIQRVVRSMILFGSVRGEEWIPVVWGGEGYRAPTRHERRRLFNVFAKGIHRKKWLSRIFERWEKKWEIDFLDETEDALFLIPEIPSGQRLDFLDDLASTGARQAQMVAICHDLLSWSSPQWTAPSRRKDFDRYLRFLGLIERVICPSTATAKEWKRFQAEEGIVGPEPEVLPWPIHGEPVAFPVDKGLNPLVLCVGTLEPRKNHSSLLDAAEILWSKGVEFELVLAGRVREKSERDIPERVEKLARAGRKVSWTGPVSDQMLEDLYQRSSFTVFPSLAEGYGLPIAESLARGRPCVCSDSGAMGEIATGGGCLTTDVATPDKLAKSMEKLLREKDLLEDLVEQAKARTWPDWEDWLNLLIGNSGGSLDCSATEW